MTRAALAAACAIALVAGSGGAPPRWVASASPAGISVRHPAGWRVTTRNPTPTVTDPVFRLGISSPSGTKIELWEPALPPRGFPSRPARFRLSRFGVWEEHPLKGGAAWFRQRGRAFYVFVLPRRAEGPTVEQVLDSLRIAARPRRVYVLGRSALGRPIRAVEVGGSPRGRSVLVVGCIHGDECAGSAIASRLAAAAPRFDLWLVPNLNPDGRALGTRLNGRGVDLNRNFPSEWRPLGRRGDPEYSGPRPLSEPEARIARALVLRLRPELTIWFHQPQSLVRAWGQSVPAAREYARIVGVRFRRIRWPAGTASNWQNHRFPGTSSFVVELPPGPLSPGAVERYAQAVLLLPQ